MNEHRIALGLDFKDDGDFDLKFHLYDPSDCAIIKMLQDKYKGVKLVVNSIEFHHSVGYAFGSTLTIKAEKS